MSQKKLLSCGDGLLVNVRGIFFFVTTGIEEGLNQKVNRVTRKIYGDSSMSYYGKASTAETYPQILLKGHQ